MKEVLLFIMVVPNVTECSSPQDGLFEAGADPGLDLKEHFISRVFHVASLLIPLLAIGNITFRGHASPPPRSAPDSKSPYATVHFFFLRLEGQSIKNILMNK